MKQKLSIGVISALIALTLALTLPAAAADGDPWKFEGVYYLHYRLGETDKRVAYSDFRVSRAYVTLKKDVASNVSTRITMDTHQDDTGDMKVRLKFAYGVIKFADVAFIKKNYVEFGLVHTPWIDYEQSINSYRSQGSMYSDRVGIVPSADFGATFIGHFGDEMGDDYKKSVGKKFAGRFGSYSLGIYNGGGYNAKEKNNSKTAGVRLSLRPLPDQLAGLQVHYYGTFGKANRAEADTLADWNTNIVALSYQSAMFTLTGQYLTGGGNKGGTRSWYDSDMEPFDYSGYSVFAEGKMSSWRAMARYDFFDPNVDKDEDDHNRLIIGLGHIIVPGAMLLLDHEVLTSAKPGTDKASETKLTLSFSVS